MLPQVVVWRLQLLDDVRSTCSPALESHVAVRLIHVIDVVLVLHGLSVMLILEYFCEDTLGAGWHTRVVSIASVLYAHTSSVDRVELVLDSAASGRALATGRPWIIAALCDRRPLDIELGGLSGYQVLRLIAARLDHQTLVDGSLIRARHVAADRVGIKGLPSILLGASLHLTVRPDLHHSIDERLVELILGLVPPVLRCASRNQVLLSLCSLLRYQTHGQLPDVD